MTDTERLDWLEVDSSRLEDVRGRVENENVDIRVAIDWLASNVEKPTFPPNRTIREGDS